MPRVRSLRSYFPISVMLLLLAGCAGTSMQPEPPEISVSGVKPVELGLEKQVFRFSLTAHNPNNFDLDVEKIEFVTRIAGIELGTGVSATPFSIPGKDDSVADVDVTLDLARAVSDIKSKLLSGGLNLEYELDGNVNLAGDLPAIPFVIGGTLLE